MKENKMEMYRNKDNKHLIKKKKMGRFELSAKALV
jgi:hypothetical protein